MSAISKGTHWLLLLSLWSGFSLATELTFPRQPLWKAPQFLSFLLRKAPLEQVQDFGDRIVLQGPFELNLSRLSQKQKAELLPILNQLNTEKIEFNGAYLDASAAQLAILTEDLSQSEATELSPLAQREQDERVRIVPGSVSESLPDAWAAYRSAGPRPFAGMGCSQLLLSTAP